MFQNTKRRTLRRVLEDAVDLRRRRLDRGSPQEGVSKTSFTVGGWVSVSSSVSVGWVLTRRLGVEDVSGEVRKGHVGLRSSTSVNHP